MRVIPFDVYDVCDVYCYPYMQTYFFPVKTQFLDGFYRSWAGQILM